MFRPLITILIFAFLFPLGAVRGQHDFHSEPVNYDSAPTTDRVGRLAAQLASGRINLDWDSRHGWLPSLLEALEIDPRSQTLVFSKTSRQATRIDPTHPRAIYFNDDTYVGAVQNGPFLELAVADPRQGAIFYSLNQDPEKSPRIIRDDGQCLTCHATHHTQDVPGFLVRSVFPNPAGHPEFRLGTVRTDHRTPFEDRFGGWYVTGRHGSMRHRGNVTLPDRNANRLDRDAGANQMRLPSAVDPDQYLGNGSDIVALMLLEHQSQFHNWVTRASYTCREALHYQETMNELLGNPAGTPNESARRRIQRAAEDLVQYVLFCDEFQLTSPVEGDVAFKEFFESHGPSDSSGRSLRQLDLQTRLLKYPCSYLIYSDSFLNLPDEILAEVRNQLTSVLTGEPPSERFEQLSREDRKNIFEILRETHPLFSDSDGTPRSIDGSDPKDRKEHWP